MIRTLKLLTLILMLGVTASVTVRGQGNPSVTGDFVRAGIGGHSHIVLNVVVHKDGSVTGFRYYENDIDPIVSTAVIDDVLFSDDGKAAYLHMVIIDTSDERFGRIGDQCVQKVTDNGEGKRAAGPDMGTATYCGELMNLAALVPFLDRTRSNYEVTAGNIQVRSRE